MYKVQLNTFIPYNYSFFCPVANISLSLVNRVALVEELTPSIRRGIRGKTLIVEKVEFNREKKSNGIEVNIEEEVKPIEEAKEEVQEENLEEVKEVKEEIKEEPVKEAKEEVKEEIKEEVKEEKPKKRKTKKASETKSSKK